MCRRYAGRSVSGMLAGWLCARSVQLCVSEVVPGFSYYKKDMLHPMTRVRRVPPNWCERPLEQVVLDSDADIEARPDETMMYDGNPEAQRHLEERMAKRERF